MHGFITAEFVVTKTEFPQTTIHHKMTYNASTSCVHTLAVKKARLGINSSCMKLIYRVLTLHGNTSS